MRKGQSIFNFLEWLRQEKGVTTNQNIRMADPFHLSDEEWDKYLKVSDEEWDKYLKEWKELCEKGYGDDESMLMP